MGVKIMDIATLLAEYKPFIMYKHEKPNAHSAGAPPSLL